MNMKLPLLILVLLISSVVISQSLKKDYFSVGLTCGSLMSNAKLVDNTEDLISTAPIQGVKFGIAGKAEIATDFYFEPEINYIRKGGKFDTKYQGNIYSNEMVMSFLEVPLNVTYKFSKKEKAFFLGLGYTMSLGLTGKLTSSFGNSTENYDIQFWSNYSRYSNNKNSIYFNTVEHSVMLVGGYSINKKINIKALFNQSFTSLPQSYLVLSNPSKTNYFGITLSYLFFDIEM